MSVSKHYIRIAYEKPTVTRMSVIPETLINHILSFRPTHPIAAGFKKELNDKREEYEFELRVCRNNMETIAIIFQEYENNEEALYDYIYPSTDLDLPDSVEYYAERISELTDKLSSLTLHIELKDTGLVNIFDLLAEEERRNN